MVEAIVSPVYNPTQTSLFTMTGCTTKTSSTTVASIAEVINPEQTNLILEIHNGMFCYEAVPAVFDEDAAKQHPFTVLTDKDGKIFFLNYAENGYAK